MYISEEFVSELSYSLRTDGMSDSIRKKINHQRRMRMGGTIAGTGLGIAAGSYVAGAVIDKLKRNKKTQQSTK